MQLSLNWKIFLFYILFGLVPFIALSYYSLSEYTKTIESITEKQVTELLNRISDQTETLSKSIQKDLKIVSETPEIQLAFVQFITGPRLKTVEEKLVFFMKRSGIFQNITIYSSAGNIIASTEKSNSMIPQTVTTEVFDNATDETSIHENTSSKYNSITMYHKIFDFQHSTHFVGIVAAQLNMDIFVAYLREFDIGIDVEKVITNSKGQTIYHKGLPSIKHYEINSSEKKYTTFIDTTGWTIHIIIPKEELFANVNQQWRRSISFAILASILAAIAAFISSRIITVPINKIIIGTKQFASGNLDYRIELKGNNEITKLANEIDSMASQLINRQIELEKANKLASLGMLSAGIAHEIKNPLAGIRTSAQGIQQISDHDAIKEMSSGIQEEVDRLTKILTDMLDFSRPQISNASLFMLNQTIYKALALIQNDISKKRVTINCDMSDIYIRADKDQILQVLVNLLLNAVHALPTEKGKISIKIAKQKTNQTVLFIKDNGYGIPEADLDKIFDPFFSSSKDGIGLGLSIVYSLLAQNNARIYIDSNAGTGTVIKIIFTDIEYEVLDD